MAYTDRGKEIVQSVGLASATRYISLHVTNGDELADHGYARKAITAANMSVANDGVVTGPTNLEIYTADDGSAQRAHQCALYDAAAAGNQILEPESLTGTVPAAPVDGQAFRLTLTMNP